MSSKKLVMCEGTLLWRDDWEDYSLPNDPSFPNFSLIFGPVIVFVVFLRMSYFLLSLCIDAATFAWDVKMPQISALRKFCLDYQFCHNFLHKFENAKLKNATNFKLAQIFRCHTFQNATNMPLYSYFCHIFSLCFPSFVLICQYMKYYFFLTFSHIWAGYPKDYNSN